MEIPVKKLMATFRNADNIVVCNDSLTKKVFSLDAKTYESMLQNQVTCEFKEGTKKKKEIKAKFQLSFEPPKNLILTDEELAAIKKPLDQFDRAVFTAAVSNFESGSFEKESPESKYFTKLIPLTALYRLISGSDNRNVLTVLQINAIKISLYKLMSVKLKVNTTEAAKLLEYRDYKGVNINKPLLTARIVTVEKNEMRKAQETTIKFTMLRLYEDWVPPLLSISKGKNNQLLTIDRRRLESLKTPKSVDAVVARLYVLMRVHEIIGRSILTSTITFDDVFQKCGIDEKKISRDRKATIRNAVFELMESLKTDGVIKSFEPIKEEKKVSGVKFKKMPKTRTTP